MDCELLAPAGDFDTAIAAFDAGADAVYAGLGDFSARAFAQNFTLDEMSRLVKFSKTLGRKVYVTFNTLVDERDMGRAMEELAALEPDEAKAFLDDIGATESGLQRVIRTGYKLLDYCTFFTTGKDETRAWTIVNGTAAPEAAGKIHTDMQHGFIRMEVVSYDELVAHGGWNAAKTAGKLRTEGKDYIVKDGDCVYVLFNK